MTLILVIETDEIFAAYWHSVKDKPAQMLADAKRGRRRSIQHVSAA